MAPVGPFLASFLPSFPELPPLVWSGLVTGSLGAMIGASMVLALRGTGTLNLAIGAFYVIGGLVASVLASRTPMAIVAIVLVAGAAGVLVAVAQERLLLLPLQRAQPPIRLLITMAFGTLMDGIVIVIWGTQPLNGAPVVTTAFKISNGFVISATDIMTVAIAVLVGMASSIWLRRSLSGHVLTGMTENPEAAEMLGIPVRQFRLVILAGVGGMMAIFGALTISDFLTEPVDGINLSLEGFIAAYLLGGNLSPLLAVGGGLVVGLIQVFAARMISSTVSGVVVGVLLIMVLVLRRGRILGRLKS